MKLVLYLIWLVFLSLVIGLGINSYWVKSNRSPKIIGSFDFMNAKTSVVSAGGCTVFMTQFDGEQKPMFYFACEK
jgi:hypothetical protein